MNKVKILIKVVFVVSILLAQNWLLQTVGPLIANDLALNQMSNSADSSLGIQLYSYVTNHLWLVPFLFTVIIFIPEMIYLFKHFRNVEKISDYDYD